MRLDLASSVLTTTRPGYCRRGFNLIEMAVVLGVVGLVIGGIWVASERVSYWFKLNDTVNGIMQIAQGIQNGINRRSASSIPHNDTAQLASFVAAAITLPTGFRPYGGGFTYPIGFSDGGVSGVLNLQQKSYSIPQFYMWISFARKQDCMNITRRVSQNAGYDLGNLAGILLQNNVTYSAPVALDTLDSVCTDGGYAAYIFNYTR